ncbi:hypothetical protein [Massilia sp. TSP1-1-2]|uniref:hypothetical protein n=1 Tax=unclassified Massilia TaxID=2609279 RepID=UPI003CE6B473
MQAKKPPHGRGGVDEHLVAIHWLRVKGGATSYGSYDVDFDSSWPTWFQIAEGLSSAQQQAAYSAMRSHRSRPARMRRQLWLPITAAKPKNRC